jgi:alpha-1,6-mannosyltransferase
MSIPTSVPATTSATAAPQRLSRLREFATTTEGRPALLGCLGAALITTGGLGAGSTKQHDPLLESLHLSWLRYGHGLVLSSVVLWIGVTLMLSAWLWLGRRALAGDASEYTMVASAAFWLTPLLLSVPLFSTTAPYGPAFIMIAKLITMLVGNHVIAGTMLLRLCMLPGFALLIWATPRIARHIGANVPIALWICALNPLVIIHLMGGVHNEMLMVGLMAAGIALTLGSRHIAGIALIAVGVAVKATAGIALPFMVWVWMRHLCERRGYRPQRAFAAAAGSSVLIFVAVFAVLSGVAGVGLGWLTALAGSVKIINWLSIPTAAANLIHGIGGLFFPISFYAVLQITRAVGIAIVGLALPLLWWRFRHDDRQALTGIAWAMLVVVLFAPAALPWYYSWPLAVLAPLAQSRRAVAAIAAFSTWIMVIFKPDGAHGMYSWPHVLLATAVAFFAWRTMNRPAAEAQPV